MQISINADTHHREGGIVHHRPADNLALAHYDSGGAAGENAKGKNGPKKNPCWMDGTGVVGWMCGWTLCGGALVLRCPAGCSQWNLLHTRLNDHGWIIHPAFLIHR